jgi:hypothetical protein
MESPHAAPTKASRMGLATISRIRTNPRDAAKDLRSGFHPLLNVSDPSGTSSPGAVTSPGLSPGPTTIDGRSSGPGDDSVTVLQEELAASQAQLHERELELVAVQSVQRASIQRAESFGPLRMAKTSAQETATAAIAAAADAHRLEMLRLRHDMLAAMSDSHAKWMHMWQHEKDAAEKRIKLSFESLFQDCMRRNMHEMMQAYGVPAAVSDCPVAYSVAANALPNGIPNGVLGLSTGPTTGPLSNRALETRIPEPCAPPPSAGGSPEASSNDLPRLVKSDSINSEDEPLLRSATHSARCRSPSTPYSTPPLPPKLPPRDWEPNTLSHEVLSNSSPGVVSVASAAAAWPPRPRRGRALKSSPSVKSSPPTSSCRPS